MVWSSVFGPGKPVKEWARDNSKRTGSEDRWERVGSTELRELEAEEKKAEVDGSGGKYGGGSERRSGNEGGNVDGDET